MKEKVEVWALGDTLGQKEVEEQQEKQAWQEHRERREELDRKERSDKTVLPVKWVRQVQEGIKDLVETRAIWVSKEMQVETDYQEKRGTLALLGKTELRVKWVVLVYKVNKEIWGELVPWDHPGQWA